MDDSNKSAVDAFVMIYEVADSLGELRQMLERGIVSCAMTTTSIVGMETTLRAALSYIETDPEDDPGEDQPNNVIRLRAA